MTDEGMVGNPLDQVEMTHDLKNIARTIRVFYDGLTEAGFNKKEALIITLEYVRGLLNIFKQ